MTLHQLVTGAVGVFFGMVTLAYLIKRPVRLRTADATALPESMIHAAAALTRPIIRRLVVRAAAVVTVLPVSMIRAAASCDRSRAAMRRILLSISEVSCATVEIAHAQRCIRDAYGRVFCGNPIYPGYSSYYRRPRPYAPHLGQEIGAPKPRVIRIATTTSVSEFAVLNVGLLKTAHASPTADTEKISTEAPMTKSFDFYRMRQTGLSDFPHV